MDLSNPNLTERQEVAWKTLNMKAVKSVLYGGAKGGGKSFLLCVWCMSFCLWAIKKYNIQPTNNPIHLGWAGRQVGTDFTSTTLQTWQHEIPDKMYVIKSATEKQPKHVLINNSIAIDFGGLDRREDINKFNSAEYAFIAIDQAEETTKDDVAVLRGSLRLTINGRQLPYKELYTANPANCWLKDDFIISPSPKHRFIQALPADNPHLPSDYLDTLKEAFGHRPKLLEAYLYGSWDLSDDVDQVIKSIWIEKAAELLRIAIKPKKRRFLTCDVARYGDNETVIYYMHDTDIIEEFIYGKRGIDYTVNRLTALSRERNECPVIVDEGGLGGGVVDVLSANYVNVIAANSGVKPKQQPKSAMYHYGNKRAEIWDNAAKMFSRGEVELHHKCPVLKKQLCVPKYKYRAGRIFIESKEEITKRLGHGQSPDRADAYVNGLYFGKQVSETDDNEMISDIGISLIPNYIGG